MNLFGTGHHHDRRFAGRATAAVTRGRFGSPSEWRKHGRPSVPGICLLALLAVLFAGCAEKAEQRQPPPPKVTIAQPERRVMTDYMEFTGNTEAIHTVQLVARVAGYLEKVLFDDGQMVKKGQPLFLIQQDTYEHNLQQAEASILQYQAQLDYAKSQYARYSGLVKKDAVSRADVENQRYQRDTALANLRSAEARRDLAKLDLSYTDIRAPFDGRIDRRLKDPGNLVGAGENTVLAEVNQVDPIYVYFNISDLDLARLLKNKNGVPGPGNADEWPVFAGLPNEEGYPHEGHLDFASISLTTTTGTLLVRGVFPNPDGKILPGLYARLHVVAEKKPYLLVPEVAVSYDQLGAHVLVVNEKNTVERRNVTTGPSEDGQRAIADGLEGGEWVVVKGLMKAAPGRPVTPERQGAAPEPGQSPPAADSAKKAGA